ncbi:tryptophan 2,3-dioxygenase family protein [Cytophagaceae bacterium DM2B3-1]|uniref:Tryptophan 2,3-dioxygenase family protein n=1 Tax=Xanthocytophaga flava TaxID=3048013 RepID=A0ABT7CXL2_9BACT|nr:tryptophan 2,3-dioxygenase family protein [Xanthocytophaga flavus]MDJ1467458.1 tryptophan 2,3-dioxygenase family protein [Xanthocytophaga flavus]MDJ1498511.1 tryptophan 2,3-dioxygenase family protein [Xanthocytophaga flavus]
MEQNSTNSQQKVDELLKALEEKYAAMGQDMPSYLQGLLYADYLTYWDYVHLDTLLSLQNPRTDFPDEMIFITFHQSTELYFKLVLWEIQQIANNEALTIAFFTERIKRICRYFEILVQSFDVMIEGMDKSQFLQYRMSLLPASGFQSVQYRMIEIGATRFRNLVEIEQRHQLPSDSTIAELYEHLYWKMGATELATKQKTLTLKQFEKKYAETLIKLAEEYESKNLWMRYRKITLEQGESSELINALRRFDALANVNWTLAHYKSAARYLHKDQKVIAATGGTNWQQYLPPRFQKRIFYPELWSEEEKVEWGKSWVDEVIQTI